MYGLKLWNKMVIAGLVVYALSRFAGTEGLHSIEKLMEIIAVLLIIAGEVIFFKNRRKK